MTARIKALLFFSLSLMLAGCGDDTGPTSRSSVPNASMPTMASSFGGVAFTALNDLTTVAEILGNPDAFLGQVVQLQGSLTEQFESGELLFTDATGSMPADFSASSPPPGLNTPILVNGTVAAGLVGGFAVKIVVTSWEMLPSFNCDDIIEVRARFSDPGFALGNVVGLFLSYRGVPAGEKVLEMNWDQHNPSGSVEEFALGEGRPREDGLFDLEGIVSHEYADVRGTEQKQVRAVLRIEGREGGCSRVRDVTVTPGSGPGFAGGGTLQVSIDEGDTIDSGTTFAIRAKVSNPTSANVDVEVLFETPDRSSIREASGPGCKILDGELVECLISLKGGEGVTRVVRYRAPTVSKAVQISGAVGLVSGDFAPVVPYRITVTP